jgi:O-antigen ligase
LRFQGLTRILPGAAVAAAVFWTSYDGGSYDILDRGTIVVCVWWALALGLTLRIWPLERIPRSAVLAGGLLAALTLLTGLSAFWADSSERALREGLRTALYLGIFLLTVFASRAALRRGWIGGIAAGISGIAVVALLGRFFPQVFDGPQELARLLPAAERRLSYPVDYWNGLGTLLAFGVPLLLFLAVWSRRHIAAGLAAGCVPLHIAAIYLTSSRGASIALALGLIVVLALTDERWATAGAMLVCGVGSGAALGIVLAYPDIVEVPLESGAAERDGGKVAILLAVVAAGTGIAYGFLHGRSLPVGAAARRRFGIALVATALALLVVGLATADPRQRFENFKEIPPGYERISVREHLFSGSGGGRWQLWNAGVDQWREDPLLGDGAGTFEAWWLEHASVPLFVRDAHSLYIEAAAELGLVGLVLVLMLVGLVVVTGVRRSLASAREARAAAAALTGVAVVFALEAGVDWIWEVTSVCAVFVVVMGLLTGPATVPDLEPRPLRRSAWPLRAGVIVAALSLLAAQVLVILSTLEVRRSQAAAERGDVASAVDRARSARRLEPWAASPRLQLALAYEQAGELSAAHEAIEQALGRDATDWKLWLVAARIETRLGLPEAAEASLDEAMRLNPRSALFGLLPG